MTKVRLTASHPDGRFPPFLSIRLQTVSGFRIVTPAAHVALHELPSLYPPAIDAS